ncbi:MULTISPECIES: NucA/NucB deoxyribonuclease domain-containing protein [Bacillales]|uniref:NucA/NucB deoxyribonuclease domain-containing protein n=1 Tax=Bacillales TaxID=1385 RepID=UPI0011A2A185|nr:NucA/NucB deoxyribonuclease domain-containing protein [Paenibacillus sp. Y412MC10]
MKKLFLKFGTVVLSLLLVWLVLIYFPELDDSDVNPQIPGTVVELEFPADKYPETADHIKKAIESGHSDVCTIDRTGAEDNRSSSLKGIPTKKGYDRDEWPMAMCAEGGDGASVEYIDPSDNRGAGSWVGNYLEGYPDGTQVHFIFR